MTSEAFLDSMREVMWFNPYLTTFGLTTGAFSTFSPLTALTSTLAAASNRAFFCCLVSGRYFSRKLRRDAATLLGAARAN